MSCKVAELLPYEKLIACVKSIDIGWIGNVQEDFCYDLNEDKKVDETLNTISAIHGIILFKVAQENLLWFNNKINTLHVAVVGDGAPFGKDDIAS